jgi:hypothetical protein
VEVGVLVGVLVEVIGVFVDVGAVVEVGVLVGTALWNPYAPRSQLAP